MSEHKSTVEQREQDGRLSEFYFINSSGQDLFPFEKKKDSVFTHCCASLLCVCRWDLSMGYVLL